MGSDRLAVDLLRHLDRRPPFHRVHIPSHATRGISGSGVTVVVTGHHRLHQHRDPAGPHSAGGIVLFAAASVVSIGRYWVLIRRQDSGADCEGGGDGYRLTGTRRC